MVDDNSNSLYPKNDQLILLEKACKMAGFDHSGAELISVIGNAVFRLRKHRIVIRIALTPAMSKCAETAVTAARLFAAHGVPAVELSTDLPQPSYVDDLAVTFWREVPPVSQEATIADLAGLLKQVHAISVKNLPLATWDPIPELLAKVRAAEYWDRGDIQFLTDRCLQLQEQLAGLRYALPTAVIHGDAHLSNVIMSPEGAVLCDFDHVCVGPSEVDLTPLAVFQLRFQPQTNNHQKMAEAYGFDVAQWGGFPVLAGLRELQILTGALEATRTVPKIRAELARRMRLIRTGDTETKWIPY